MIDASTGEVLGVVEGWQQYGGPPLMEVRVDGREVLIPFVRAICREVDLEAQTIRVDLPEGCWICRRLAGCDDAISHCHDFPGVFRGAVRARRRSARRKLPVDWKFSVHDLRNWTYDRHRTVDDRPFGGGEGMLLKPQPLFEAVEAILPRADGRAESGSAVGAGTAVRPGAGARVIASLDDLLLICGRYEGVDERVAEHLGR